MSWELVGIIYELMIIIVLMSNKKWASRWFLGNIGLLVPFYGGAFFAGLFYVTGYGATSLRILLLTILIGTNLWACRWAKKLRLRKQMNKGVLLGSNGLQVSMLALGGFVGITLFFPESTMELLLVYFFALIAFYFYEDIRQRKLFLLALFILIQRNGMKDAIQDEETHEKDTEEEAFENYHFLLTMLSYYFKRWPYPVDRQKRNFLLAMYFYMVIQSSEMEKTTQEEKVHYLFILNSYVQRWPY